MAPCEWVIDIIKEWVITRGYAAQVWVLANFYTQTEVEEWVKPVHVSGTLNPNATCTYFKTGIHDGKPLYIRDDGLYWIWWNAGISQWFISANVGSPVGFRWIRSDPDIEGVYLPFGGATGNATITASYGCPKRCFIDRGDPAAASFSLVNFTTDGAWHDLDLSAIVPAGAKGVAMSVILVNAAVFKNVMFRKKGNANIWNRSLVTIQVATIPISDDIEVPIDTDRKCEYNFVAGGWVAAFVTVKNWWF